eukprot:gene12107-25400_t
MTKSGGFLTPKAISNRIKAKGLQKLRWYCQMCQKQCRDENGMKCHMKSEGHLRAMRVFAENPNQVLSEYSREFEKGFIDTLSHRHGTKRVSANRVYQEYIGDKHHVHMNSTCWSSLTGLCKHLGKEGKCIVDETEKGWFIQYIDRDPKLIAKKAQEEQRNKADIDDEDRMHRMINSQINAAEKKKLDDGVEDQDEVEDEELSSILPDAKERTTHVSLNLTSSSKDARRQKKSISFNTHDEISFFDKSKKNTHDIATTSTTSSTSTTVMRHLEEGDYMADKDDFLVNAEVDSFKNDVQPPLQNKSTSTSTKYSIANIPKSSTSTVSSLESLMLEEEKRKSSQLLLEDKKERKDYWLHQGIVVKILNRKLNNGIYYKQKGVVVGVIERYIAELKVDNVLIRIDQEELQTVLPK